MCVCVCVCVCARMCVSHYSAHVYYQLYLLDEISSQMTKGKGKYAANLKVTLSKLLITV